MTNGWIAVNIIKPVPGKLVDVTDGKNVDVGSYDYGCGCWQTKLGICSSDSVIGWKPRPAPPRVIGKRGLTLDVNAFYDPNSELGKLEPVVLYYRDEKRVLPFHITECAYIALNGGEGMCYGRTPWGPFCKLKVYDYRVVGYNIVQDEETVQALLDSINS